MHLGAAVAMCASGICMSETHPLGKQDQVLFSDLCVGCEDVCPLYLCLTRTPWPKKMESFWIHQEELNLFSGRASCK